MSILEGPKKINIYWTVGVSVVLIGLLGLGIAKLEALSAKIEPIRIIPAMNQTSQTIQTFAEKVEEKKPADERVVGSKNGKKYHLLDCPGAKTISEANRLYFPSRQAAEKAGYTPAANCKAINQR